MRTGNWLKPALLSSAALALLIWATTPAEANTLRYHQPSSIVVALRAPIVLSEPIRAEETDAAPEEEAYFTTRARRTRPPRGNPSGWVDDDNDDEDGPRRASARENSS